MSKQGYFVMDDERNVIQLLPDGGPIKGGPDGSINQKNQVIGMLGIRSSHDPSSFIRTHGGFVLDHGVELEAFHLDSDKISVRHGALEQSNVSNTGEMVNLISVSRAFQLNQQVIRGKDELLGKAIQTLGGRF